MGLALGVLVVRIGSRTPHIAHSRTDRKDVCLSFIVLPKPKLDEHILPVLLVGLRDVRCCRGVQAQSRCTVIVLL